MKGVYMDIFLRKIQHTIFSIDDKIGFIKLYKLGNKLQDFRNKYTI